MTKLGFPYAKILCKVTQKKWIRQNNFRNSHTQSRPQFSAVEGLLLRY